MDQIVSTFGPNRAAVVARHDLRQSDRPRRDSFRDRAPQAPARVPMLDWPEDLFSDNISSMELVSEDARSDDWFDAPQFSLIAEAA